MRWIALALIGALGCDGASPLDAGPSDGGRRADAGALDAGLLDAGSLDAGSLDAGAREPTLTVLSLNLHCLDTGGTPYTTNAERFAAIADEVARQDVDALLLQEVCARPGEDAVMLLQTALESAGAGSYVSHTVFAHLGWQGTPREARESVAVFARALTAPAELEHRTDDGLRRVAAGAQIESAIGSAWVTSVHFDHQSAAARLTQAREAAAFTTVSAGRLQPAIVGGDLNARSGTPALGALGAEGFVDASAAAGPDRIDHVFAHRASALELFEAQTLFDTASTRVSDHPGVLVRWRAGPGESVEWTSVLARHDPGADRYLWVRGSVAPLDWGYGLPLVPVGADDWRLLSSELAGAVELKALIDDATWQTGENVRVDAGGEVVFTPTF